MENVRRAGQAPRGAVPVKKQQPTISRDSPIKVFTW